MLTCHKINLLSDPLKSRHLNVGPSPASCECSACLIKMGDPNSAVLQPTLSKQPRWTLSVQTMGVHVMSSSFSSAALLVSCNHS